MAYNNNDENSAVPSTGHGFWGKAPEQRVEDDSVRDEQDAPSISETNEPESEGKAAEAVVREEPDSAQHIDSESTTMAEAEPIETAEPAQAPEPEPEPAPEPVETAEVEQEPTSAPAEPAEPEPASDSEPAPEPEPASDSEPADTNPYADAEWEDDAPDAPEDDAAWLDLSSRLDGRRRRSGKGAEPVSQSPGTNDTDAPTEPRTNSEGEFVSSSAFERVARTNLPKGPRKPRKPAKPKQPKAPRATVEPQTSGRLDVDGDYTLGPENHAAYDDPALAHVGLDTDINDPAVLKGGQRTMTSYLSGPPVGLSKRGKRVRIIAVVACVVVALLVLYAYGVYHFSNRYLPGTSIHSCDISGKTADEAKAALDSETKRYACAVKTGDFSMTVTGSDIGLTRDAAKLVEQTQGRQNPFLWPFTILVPTHFTPYHGAKFDEETLSALVSRAVDSYNDRVLPSDNASVRFNESSEAYELSGEVKGSAVDEQTVEKAIVESVRSLLPSCSPDAGNAFRAATPNDLPDYRNVVEHANDVRTNSINILADGEVVAVSPAEQNAAWITVEVVDGTPKIQVDRDGVQLWAEGTVSYAAYHTDDWNAHLLDTDTFVDEFCNRLSEGDLSDYDVPLIDERTREGISRDNAYEHSSWQKDMGRYIDVDLTSQFARLFDNKGEVLWESAFVSGDLIAGHSTVEGTFTIYSKELGTTLVGLDYDMDGYPDYESYVNYWMPFYGGYGLHDATWRSAFGGDLYQYDGSHGCVNLPYEKAKELFAITYVGEVVYVHW